MTEKTVRYFRLTEPESEWIIDGLLESIDVMDGLGGHAHHVERLRKFRANILALHRGSFYPKYEPAVSDRPTASAVREAFEEAYEELRSLLPDGVRITSEKLSAARNLAVSLVIAEEEDKYPPRPESQT